VRPGDVIVSVGGHPLRDAHDLVRETIAHEVGQPTALEIVRGGHHYAANVTLSERAESPAEAPAAQQPPAPQRGLGLVVRDLAPEQASQMNLPARAVPILTQVTPGSAAERAGLRPGDVIVEANGTPEPTSAQLVDLARGGSLFVRVKRGDNYFYAALKR
jgi:S1-C subfamily serine protease